jgi:hypothetical protein
MTLRRRAETRRLGGLLLAAVLVASQTAAWLHAAAVAHVTCAEHGEAVHAVSRPAAARATAAVTATVVAADPLATLSAHEHCASEALLRWRALSIAPPAASVVLPPVGLAPRLPVGPPAASASAVYRTAPKTSPPHATV